MEPSDLAKIGAAFVGGVVVALGSALIYVKVNDIPPRPLVVPPIQAPPVQVTPVQAPPAQRVAESSPVPSAAIVTPPGRAGRPAAHRQTKLSASSSPKHVPLRHALPKLSAKQPERAAAVKIARNTEQPAPAATAPEPPRSVFVPTPAVNENEAPPGPQLDLQPAPIAPQQPTPHVVTLPEGTSLVIRLGETLSTEHNYSGDTFRGTLDVPIIMDGFIIAEKGSKVLGRIAGARKAGRMEGVANLHVTLTEINTTDGQSVPVETGFIDKKGHNSGGENAAKIAGGAALGAIIGALGGGGKGAAIGAGAGGAAGTGAVLLTHGKAAVLPAETRLTFQLTHPATISEKLN